MKVSVLVSYIVIYISIKLSILEDEEQRTDCDEQDEAKFTVKRTQFTLPRLGNCALYWNRKFLFNFDVASHLDLSPPYISNDVAHSLGRCKIVAVVVNSTSPNVLAFKFYDCDRNRKVPGTNSNQWHYIPCKYLMCTDEFVKCMFLVADYESYTNHPAKKNLLQRRVCKLFKSHGYFYGTVVQYDTLSDLYTINYDDGDFETCSLEELLKILRC